MTAVNENEGFIKPLAEVVTNMVFNENEKGAVGVLFDALNKAGLNESLDKLLELLADETLIALMDAASQSDSYLLYSQLPLQRQARCNELRKQSA